MPYIYGKARMKIVHNQKQETVFCGKNMESFPTSYLSHDTDINMEVGKM
jgi:hypothetical protein